VLDLEAEGSSEAVPDGCDSEHSSDREFIAPDSECDEEWDRRVVRRVASSPERDRRLLRDIEAGFCEPDVINISDDDDQIPPSPSASPIVFPGHWPDEPHAQRSPSPSGWQTPPTRPFSPNPSLMRNSSVPVAPAPSVPVDVDTLGLGQAAYQQFSRLQRENIVDQPVSPVGPRLRNSLVLLTLPGLEASSPYVQLGVVAFARDLLNAFVADSTEYASHQVSRFLLGFETHPRTGRFHYHLAIQFSTKPEWNFDKLFQLLGLALTDQPPRWNVLACRNILGTFKYAAKDGSWSGYTRLNGSYEPINLDSMLQAALQKTSEVWIHLAKDIHDGKHLGHILSSYPANFILPNASKIRTYAELWRREKPFHPLPWEPLDGLDANPKINEIKGFINARMSEIVDYREHESNGSEGVTHKRCTLCLWGESDVGKSNLVKWLSQFASTSYITEGGRSMADNCRSDTEILVIEEFSGWIPANTFKLITEGCAGYTIPARYGNFVPRQTLFTIILGNTDPEHWWNLPGQPREDYASIQVAKRRMLAIELTTNDKLFFVPRVSPNAILRLYH